jgi:hypothetical protein
MCGQNFCMIAEAFAWPDGISAKELVDRQRPFSGGLNCFRSECAASAGNEQAAPIGR